MVEFGEKTVELLVSKGEYTALDNISNLKRILSVSKLLYLIFANQFGAFGDSCVVNIRTENLEEFISYFSLL